MAEPEITNVPSNDMEDQTISKDLSTSATQDPAESSNIPEATDESSNKQEATNESSNEPEATDESVNKPEATDESVNKPEAIDESSNKPEATDESVNKLEATDESVNKPEATDESVNKPEATNESSNKPEATNESSNKPETTDESTNKPEATDESSNKPETTDESSNKPETRDESSNKPEATNESSNKPEATDESVNKPETTDESANKQEATNEYSNKPDTTDESVNKPEAIDESSNKPETTDGSVNKPEAIDESSNKPETRDESFSKAEATDESSNEAETSGDISVTAREPATQEQVTTPTLGETDIVKDTHKLDMSQSVETSDKNENELEQNSVEAEKDTTDPTCEQSQDGIDNEPVRKSGEDTTEVSAVEQDGSVTHTGAEAESVIDNNMTHEPRPDQSGLSTSGKDENEYDVRQSIDKTDDNDASQSSKNDENYSKQDGAIGNVLKDSGEGNVSGNTGDNERSGPSEAVEPSEGAVQDSADEQPTENEPPTETTLVEAEADNVLEDITAKSETSVTKGSDKVVTFDDDVKSESGDTNCDTDLPKSPTSTIRELATSRQSERTSEFVYDESGDFPTPDFYDKALQRSVTPSVTESGKISRQESGSRRNLLSRGESNKSVTFADEINKDDDDDDCTEEVEIKMEAIEGNKTQDKAEEEAESVFTTAVSEEKIEEATARAKKSISNKQSVAVDLWGQATYELESMGDVITKKATEHFEKGCKLADQGDHCQAILAFDKAINLCPKIVTYYLARGESYLQICDFQSAILNLKRACVLDPNNDKYYSKLAFVYYFYGQTLFDQNLFAEALEAFSRASEMRPEVVGYHTRSVACLAALQRHGECLALVNKRLEMERDNPDLYIMRARLHELFRNTSLCYYDLKDALSLNPDQEEAQMLMKRLEERAQESRNNCVSLQLQGKLKEALNKITTAIETNPSVAEYHLLRGALHRRLQDYNAAIDDYLLALDKTEHNEQDHIYTESQRQLLLTYNDFAVECFLGKHYEEAIILLNKALKGEKREKGLYINRGDCFFRLNELHFALADYHQALEIDATDWMIRSRIASIHSEFGLLDYEDHSYQEAEARFTVAIQHNPRKGSYYIYRAKVRFMLENQADARHDLLMALHLDPSNDDILSLMPRLFPGKSVGDVMRSKAARTAKIAVDNAVVTASPIKLPEIQRDGGVKMTEGQRDEKVNGTAKHVAFASDGVPPHRDPSMPDIRECMSETQFNKVLTKNKKKVSDHVKTLLHDRKSLSNGTPVTLAPQPPARPYAVKGGGWKKGDDDKPQGWRTFSLGMGVMNK
ncbi:uncharacterized protein [Amphiura filiformis]|uniref:uncharacterized protein n=1 Tax=Amphiura filiformis TaxID=82378 RepID=UPI003B21431E